MPILTSLITKLNPLSSTYRLLYQRSSKATHQLDPMMLDYSHQHGDSGPPKASGQESLSSDFPLDGQRGLGNLQLANNLVNTEYHN